MVPPSPNATVPPPLAQVVNFGQNATRGKKGASKVVVKTTRDAQFQLLHLSVLREYIWAEFTRDMPEETVRACRRVRLCRVLLVLLLFFCWWWHVGGGGGGGMLMVVVLLRCGVSGIRIFLVIQRPSVGAEVGGSKQRRWKKPCAACWFLMTSSNQRTVTLRVFCEEHPEFGPKRSRLEVLVCPYR